jgi:hypothetical protein
MLDIDYLFSEDKDVIIAVLVQQIRDQNCDLENATDRAESLDVKLRYAEDAITQLKLDLAAAKKIAKAPKAPKVIEKAASAPVKRGPGRPKKAVK